MMVADSPFACQANVPQKLCHSTLHGVCLNLRLTRGQQQQLAPCEPQVETHPV